MSRDERLGVGRGLGHCQLLTVAQVIALLTMVTMVIMSTHVVAGGGRPVPRTSGGLQVISSPDYVQNVRVEHVGRGVVHVFYDLVADEPQTTFDVILQVSQDAGETFDLRATSVSGDAGQEIGVGGGKRIVWEAGRDVERMEVERFVFRVVARVDTALLPAASAGSEEWMTSLPDTMAYLSQTTTGLRLEFVGASRYGGLGVDLTPLEDEFVGSARGPGATCDNGSWRLRTLTASWQGSIRCGRIGSPLGFVLYKDRVTPSLASSSPNASKPPGPAALSNEDVVKLVSAGISEDVVIAVIRESQTRFSVGTEQLAALRDAGVSDHVLAVMREGSPVSRTAVTSVPTPGPAQIEWDLSELYASYDEWTADKERLAAQIETLAEYRGRLGESAAVLREALDAISTTERELYHLHVFAFLEADEDRRVAEAQERRGLGASLLSTFDEATSFLSPELLRVGSETIERFIAEEPGLAKHAVGLRDTLRQEPYTLSDESERVIAAVGPIVQGPERIYAMLTSSDIPFPTVTLSTGEEVRLDQAAYAKHRASQNRDDRKLVFDSFWNTWASYEATLGQTLDTNVKAHVFRAKARGYTNALEAALSGPNIPVAVYNKLVESAHKHLPSLHRYFRLRQRMLGLDDLRYYDIYPSLVASDRKFDIEESKRLTLAASAPLGPHYVELLERGFAGNWMHVYPQPGKASGAYMFGTVFDVHPFLLLNHNGDFRDVSTFAHEWGHAIHTLLSNENNPWETSRYATFTAELASTSNEVLLQEHMLAQDISDSERLFYLGSALEAVRGTFFRQVMFAEFELRIHEIVEAGEALSGEKMTTLYEELLRQYHGSDTGVLAIDPLYAVEWAFIPHFYRNFYVFQYATSIAGGTMFAERLLAGDESARDDYVAVLKAGGSRYAYELLKDYGVNLATDAPYDTLIARMDRIMDEVEAILDATP